MILGMQVPFLLELNLFTVSLRLFLAVILGGMIGFERGRKRRAAGLRTHMLVCIGATMAILVNQFICELYGTGDPARIGAQVISGIGFLGVGTIIITGKNKVKGLTTAAGLWACAAMGLSIGIGFYDGAILGTIFIFVCVTVLQKVDTVFYRKSKVIDLYAELADMRALRQFIGYIKKRRIRISDMEILKTAVPGAAEVGLIFTLNFTEMKEHSDVITQIGSIDGVQYIEELH